MRQRQTRAHGTAAPAVGWRGRRLTCLIPVLIASTIRSLRWRPAWPGVPLGVLALLLLALPTSGVTGNNGGAAAAGLSGTAQRSSAGESQARTVYGQLPLAFVPNAGQTDPRVRFTAQAAGASFFFTQKEAVLSFVKGKKGLVLRLAFLGANPDARIEGQRRGPGKVNYLLGNDPSKWRTDLRTYGEVVYRGLWPGIDLAISGAGGALKYEFRLEPGAKVSDIRLAYRGADRLTLNRAGELLIATPLGRLRDDRPRSYQVIDGKQAAVESRFVRKRGTRTYGFTLANHDARHPLVIDPGLVYSTFVGGSGGEYGWGIALDAGRNAYLTGTAHSPGFPTTTGAFQTTNGGDDAFVTKLNAAGSALAYSTYLGGSRGDAAERVAVDADGNAYVIGQTGSSDFPTTADAFQTTLKGRLSRFPLDAFVTKLNAAGSALVYSSFLGGDGDDDGFGIAVDAEGNAYVTGETTQDLGQRPSGTFPTTPGAFQTTVGGHWNGTHDAFVTKVNPTGSALVYSSYLGGSAGDRGTGIAVGADGSAYVTGVTFEQGPWLERGDVIVAAPSQDPPSSYKLYSSNGSVKTNLGFGNPLTRGCSFSSTGDKLYMTSFSTDTVLVSEPRFFSLVSTINTAAQGGASPESIVLASNGDVYVGLAGGNRDIQRYNAAGTFQQSYDVGTEASGSDWIDLAADQKTVYYTSEGLQIKRYDVGASTQLADFATLPSDGPAHALRLLPPGDESGGLLVAQTANVKRLNGSGAVVQTYDAGGENQWFSLGLDPDGASFWAGSLDTGNLYRFNIASGAVEVGPINVLAPNGNTPGGICVASTTLKEDFPTTPGAFQTTPGSQQDFGGDAFVTKVNPSGSALVYSSYLGGSGFERSHIRTPSIAVDAAGSAYLTGYTSSSDFPTTPGAFQPTFGDGGGFVTKVNANGSALAYSSYLNGAGGIDIAVDANGNAYVTGNAGPNLTTTAGAFQKIYGGDGDAFVTKVNAVGSALSYSSYLGGCHNDVGSGIAVDALGSAYIVGATTSTNFPTTPGAVQSGFGGFQDAFAAKLDLAPVAQPFVPDCGTGTGTIVVKKATDPSGSSATFQFSGDTAGTIGDGQTIVVSQLPPGTYRSTEAPRRGWRLTRITCDDTDSSGDENTRTATFRVVAGETVTCTFTNRQPPPGPPPGCGVLYSTYLGGSGNDGGSATVQSSGSVLTSTSASIAVDAAGNAYVTGETSSPDFPTTTGAFQVAPSGESDVFVTKLNAAGSAPVYSTYLGGSRADTPQDIAPDGSGAVYVAGTTSSANFPTTPGAFRITQSVGFVSKLNASGSAPAYSSYFGGSVNAIAVGGEGSAYLTGVAGSGFSTTPGAFQTTLRGTNDAFVAKMNPSGGALTYSSFLGGSSNGDLARDIAVDASGNAYVGGWTTSTDFPTAGAFQPAFGGGFNDAFVTKVNASGSALAYSSYLGGSGGGFESADAIAVGGDGSVYLTGSTSSTNFPTAGGFQSAYGGGNDAFVTKVNPSGSALAYSSFLGGSSGDEGVDLAVDGLGNVYVTGGTFSANFPTTAGASQTANGGSGDAFMTKVDPSGSVLAYSSYLGGPLPDGGAGIAVGADGNAYLTGSTWGSFPTSSGAFQTAFGGGFLDAFVTKLRPVGCGEPETGSIVVRKDTVPSPDPTDTSFAFTAGGGLSPASFSLKNGESRTFASLVPQAGYSVAETTPAGWDVTSTCSDGSPTSNIDVGPGETVTCTFTNTKGPGTGTVVVDKATNPAGDAQSFSFDASGGSYVDFSLTDAATPNSQTLAAGSYAVGETVPSGWDLTSATCASSIGDTETPATVELDAGETVSCRFTNTKRGRARVVKTVRGIPPSGTQSFTFQLRQGASTMSAGTILESADATAVNAGVINFTRTLVPGTTYALCEIVMPGWMTTLGPPFYVVFNPSGDNSTVCTDFTVDPGQPRTFAIDNIPPPGGLARTIGFWKNWASCGGSKGNQKPVLDQTLAASDPAGITIGTLTLHAGDCLKAVRLLDKSTIDTGKKMASDPAFGLAAQLLAAKLNIVAGAGSCPAAVTAINNAQALLAATHFNGITHDKLSAAQATQANSLATTLDRYNNSLLC